MKLANVFSSGTLVLGMAASMFDAVDASGRIGLQVHGVGDRADPLRVQWRNIRIRPLGVGGE